jgi:hypothetical protein
MSVTYAAVLDVSEDSVEFLAGLLADERRRIGTRDNTRRQLQRPHPGQRWRCDRGEGPDRPGDRSRSAGLLTLPNGP